MSKEKTVEGIPPDETVRLGQISFNNLHILYPAIAKMISGTEFDPFHHDSCLDAFKDKVDELMQRYEFIPEKLLKKIEAQEKWQFDRHGAVIADPDDALHAIFYSLREIAALPLKDIKSSLSSDEHGWNQAIMTVRKIIGAKL